MSFASVGAVVGSFFGPWGTLIGSALGGAVDSAVNRPDTPDPGDISAPKVKLGSSFGRPYGRVRYVVSWISIDPEFTVNEGDAGGKGEPDAPTATTFQIDALGLVCDTARVQGILREWVNKKLFVADDPGSTSPGTWSRIANQIILENGPYASALDMYGGPTQVPPPLYEARVGAANALAYRDMFTREYAGINCGTVKTIPIFEVEVYTVGSGGGPTVSIFAYTGADQSFVVPSGVTSVQVIAWGANGGSYNAIPGGGGAFISCFIAVVPGETLTVMVGGSGSGDGSSVYGGGAGGGFSGPRRAAGGGGRSAVFRAGDELCTAGAGGGAGVTNPGVPSGRTGGDGDGGLVAGGVWHGAGGSIDGNPGVQELGGSGADYNPDPPDGAGGGGGGGWLGGGGGAGGDIIGGGGGGGSSTAPGGSIIAGEEGLHGNTGNPYYSATEDGLVILLHSGGITPGVEYLSDVILAELSRHPEFDPADVDVTDIEDIEVESYNAVGSPFDTVPDLCRIYYVDVVPGNPIKFLKKGRAVVGTIPWEDTGVGVGQAGNPLEGLKQGNNDEISGVVGLQFTDLNRDHNSNLVRGDRLTTDGPDLTRLVTYVGLTPDQAKGRAITATLTNRQRKHSADFALSNKYAAAEPGDCYNVEDRDGNTYRLRIPSLSYSDTVRACKWELEDASAYVQSGITDVTDEPTINVVVAEAVDFMMVNLPSLRDADVPDPGAYGVLWWDGTDPISATLYSASADSGPFSPIGTVTRRATVGTMSSVLGNWTGGYLWDNLNSATVVLENDQMTLASSTYAAMYADPSGQVAAIGGDWGWEIVAFRLAPLVGTSTYTISSMLRGLKGTEWAIGMHQAGDRFILLADNGILRVPHQAAQIDATRYYIAARAGQGTSGLTSTAFIDDGTSLRPYSPYALQAEVSGGDVTVTWEHRSRQSVPPYSDPVLSDPPESYATELRNGGTVVSSQTVSARSVTYTHTPGYTVAVMQRNAIVGNGYEAEITV